MSPTSVPNGLASTVRQAVARGDVEQALSHVYGVYGKGEFVQAEQLCRIVLQARPAERQALHLLALILAQTGRAAESLRLFSSVASLGGAGPVLFLNWGNALRQTGHLLEALAQYQRALEMRADFAEAHSACGVVLLTLKRPAEALACFDRAITLQPDSADALSNRGAALTQLGRHAEAMEDFDGTLALRPNNAQAHYNRALTLRAMNRPLDALASCDRAIALNPNNAGAQSLKAQTLILLGRYAEGWPLHEWRWQGRQRHSARQFAQPQWKGDVSLAGKTLLICSEMGLGDTIQFSRYVHSAEAAGAGVVLEVQPALASLMATLRSRAAVVPAGQPLPPFDLYCPMMSLPYAFRTVPENIPNSVPYLYVPAEKAREWRQKLGTRTLPRVGIAWAASSSHDSGPARSMRIEELDSLLALPMEFHVMQKEIDAAELQQLAARTNVTVHAPDLRDFLDTAALIDEMDVVVSVDTVIVHVAGALAKSVLVMLPFAADYRWLMDRSDSPWYPTAQLFRQPAPDDWGSVVAAVTGELMRRL